VSEVSRSDPSRRPASGGQPPKASLAKGGKSDIKEVFDYVIPPSIAENPDAKRTFEDFMFEAQKTYDFLIAKLNEKGIKGESANQDARFILPNAAETKIMVTMNARELLHFFRQRCCYRAQWEIRQMAEEMLKLVKNVARTIFYKAGPGCLYAPCPEGEYYCGKIKEVRKKYGIKPLKKDL
jgi:thymidylate synthase (FAD)